VTTRSTPSAGTLLTERLEIVPATPEMVRGALDGPRALAAGLGASVPPTWRPDYLDAVSLQFSLERLSEGPGQAGWWLHFVVLRSGFGGRLLIGSGGYKGPPSPDGSVEVGYSIVTDHRRRGFATETVRALVGRAFSLPSVRRVIGETLPELTPSIGVLRKCGFRQIDGGSEPGVVCFELTRAMHARP